MRIAYALLAAVILLSVAPIGAVIVASWLAAAHGCILHEGYVNPCVILGADRGEALYTAFVSGWFMFLTFPVTVLATLGLLLLGGFDLVRRWRRGRASGR